MSKHLTKLLSSSAVLAALLAVVAGPALAADTGKVDQSQLRADMVRSSW